LMSLMGGAFDSPFEAKDGELWFYHPLDGTFKYSSCEVRGDWQLNSEALVLEKLAVLCEDPKQWTFDQKIENRIFVRGINEEDPSIDALFYEGQSVGQVYSQKRGFLVDFVDEWDDRHHIRVSKYLKENGELYQRLDWFVLSSEYISFDLSVW